MNKAEARTMTRTNSLPISPLPNAVFMLAALLFVFSSLASHQAVAGKERIYRWVDENGITHYGEAPPKKEVQVEKIKTRKDYSSDAKAARKALVEKRNAKGKPEDDAKASSENEAAEKLIEARKKKIDEGCKTAKNNLQILTTHGRVRETGSDGEQRFLSEEDHNNRIREASDYIKNHCGSGQ
jgi:hypothetical protein